MGLNADNIFVNATDRNSLLGAVAFAFKGKKWKAAISTPIDGWVQIIESHENTPPDIAQKLSENLKCLVVCTQLYESAGEIAWYIFENGVEIEAVHKESPDDPSQEIKDVLLKMSVPFEIRLFREVISKKDGWAIEQSRS